MPYIEKHRREDIAKDDPAESSGELNYIITKECITYLNYHGLAYKTINEIIGALECAKQEFYRRLAVDYENLKCKINGDVYI